MIQGNKISWFAKVRTWYFDWIMGELISHERIPWCLVKYVSNKQKFWICLVFWKNRNKMVTPSTTAKFSFFGQKHKKEHLPNHYLDKGTWHLNKNWKNQTSSTYYLFDFQARETQYPCETAYECIHGVGPGCKKKIRWPISQSPQRWIEQDPR